MDIWNSLPDSVVKYTNKLITFEARLDKYWKSKNSVFFNLILTGLDRNSEELVKEAGDRLQASTRRGSTVIYGYAWGACVACVVVCRCWSAMGAG